MACTPVCGALSLILYILHSSCSVVKEEIADDDAPLPNTNGRVVCWVRPFSLSLSLSNSTHQFVTTPEGQLTGYLVTMPSNRQDISSYTTGKRWCELGSASVKHLG